jgi:hypothetical protein
MFCTVIYGEKNRDPGGGRQAWSLLVRRRITANKATPLGELLKMDHRAMLQPHYAEAWALVGLLSEKPAKFGKLLFELRESGSGLAAIEKVYGWDEKRLTDEWIAYAMAQK